MNSKIEQVKFRVFGVDRREIEESAFRYSQQDIYQYDWKEAWRKYREKVWELTNMQPIHTLEHFNKRGFSGYHLDHKISIKYGWKNHLPPERIAHISNLRFIPSNSNMKKGIKSEVGGLVFK